MNITTNMSSGHVMRRRTTHTALPLLGVQVEPTYGIDRFTPADPDCTVATLDGAPVRVRDIRAVIARINASATT